MINAQELSKEEALHLSAQLLELEILSEKGKAELDAKIDKESFRRMSLPSILDRSNRELHNTSKAQVLLFLFGAFNSELEYRSGLKLRREIYEQELEDVPFQERSESLYARIEKVVERQMESFDGYQIEEAILDEEEVPTTSFRLDIDHFNFERLDNGLINKKRSVFGKTKSRLVKDLNQLDLISADTMNDLMDKIVNQEVLLEKHVLMHAYLQLVQIEDLPWANQQELLLAQRLKKVGLLSSGVTLETIAKENESSIMSKFDFLNYCENALVVEVGSLPQDVAEAYLEIYGQIDQIIEGFSFSDFKLDIKTIKDEWGDDSYEQRAKISFIADGQLYKHEFWYDWKRAENKNEVKTAVREGFHKGVNKWLADQDSEQRLYFANAWGKANNPYGQEKFGVILMSEAQYQAWDPASCTYFLFEENHSNSFNRAGLEKAFAFYKELGLFSHLDAEEISQGKKKMKTEEVLGHADLLAKFPKVLVNFDWESENLETPYEELTLAFADASRGAFDPRDIVDDFEDRWEEKTTHYGFDLGRKSYKIELEMDNDWLDPMFLEFINSALAENHIDGKIHYCYDDGQAAGYLFLTEAQFNILRKEQPELFPEEY